MSWLYTRFTSGPSFSVSAHFLARSGSARQAAFFLRALLVAFPAPDVHDLVALLAHDGRPEADQAEAVLLPLVDREAAEAVDAARGACWRRHRSDGARRA